MEQFTVSSKYEELRNVSKFEKCFKESLQNVINFFKVDFMLMTAYLIAFFTGLTGLTLIAFNYLMKDVLIFTPSQMSRINSLMFLPWMIKPLFGLISDSFPICGYRRKSYLFIGSVVFISAYIILYYFCNIESVFVSCFITGSFCLAFCNVIGEALVVETSNAKGKDIATKNVSNFYLIKAVGNLLSTLSSGYLLEQTSPNFIFMISSFTPLLISISCFFLIEKATNKGNGINALSEEAQIDPHPQLKKTEENEVNLDNDLNGIHDLSDIRKERSHEFMDLRKEQNKSKKSTQQSANFKNDKYEGFEKVTTRKNNEQLSNNESNNTSISSDTDKYQQLCDDANTKTSSENGKEVSQNITKIDNLEIEEPKKDSLIGKQISLLFGFVSQKQIYKPILFILAFVSSPSYDDAMFYFYTNTLNFNKIQIGRLNFIGALASVIGIFLYKKWLHKFGFKSIMFSSTIIMTFFSMMSICLVLRWNAVIGLPDFLFAMAANTITTALAEINMMPLCILAANLCPKNIEGVTYALMMSVIFLGLFLSYNFGSLMTFLLGITNLNFSNLWILILIANLIGLLPLPLLLVMDDVKQDHNNKEIDSSLVVGVPIAIVGDIAVAETKESDTK